MSARCASRRVPRTARRRYLGRFERGDPSNPIERYASVTRAPSGIGKLRQQVGKGGLPTLLRAIVEIGAGKFEATRYSEAEDRKIFVRVLGHKRRDDEYEGILGTLGALAEGNFSAVVQALESCTDEDLDQLRDEIIGFFRRLPPSAARMTQHPHFFKLCFRMWFIARRVSPTLQQTMQDLTSG